MSAGINRLKSGSLWALCARLAGSGSGLVSNLLTTRLVSVESAGSYFIFVSLVKFGGMVAMLGMDNAMQKTVSVASSAGEWSTVRRYVRVVLRLLLLSSLACGVVVLAGWQFITENMFRTAVLGGLGLALVFAIPMKVAEDLGSAFFRSVHRAGFGVFLYELPRQVALMIILIGLYWMSSGIAAGTLVYAYMAASAAAVLFVIGAVTKFLRSHRGVAAAQPVSILEFAKLAAPMGIHGWFSTILTTADLWIVGILCNTHDVGIYGASMRLVGIIVITLGITDLVLPSLIAPVMANNRTVEAERLLRMCATWSSMVGIPLAIVFVVFAPQILTIAYGSSYQEGATIFRYLVVGYTAYAIVGSPSVLMQMAGHQSVVMRISMTNAILKVAVSFVAGYFHGAAGVALTGCCFVISQHVSLAWYVRSRMGIRTWMYPLLPRKAQPERG